MSPSPAPARNSLYSCGTSPSDPEPTAVCRHIILIATLLLTPMAAFAQADVKTPDLSKVVTLIVDRTNDFRKAEKREPVKVNPELTKAADYFAKFMAQSGEYGHEADGSKPADRAKKHGYEHCIVLENIAYMYDPDGFTSEGLGRGLMKGWQESSGHRKNMLDPDVTETGVAVARSEKTGYFYAVQMFGRPKSLAIEFKIANRTDVKLEYTIGEDKYTLEPLFNQTHTRCRAGEITFTSPKGLEAVKAGAGDKFAVTGKNGTYQVKKE
jgi:uncharacterized protein YkwD